MPCVEYLLPCFPVTFSAMHIFYFHCCFWKYCSVIWVIHYHVYSSWSLISFWIYLRIITANFLMISLRYISIFSKPQSFVLAPVRYKDIGISLYLFVNIVFPCLHLFEACDLLCSIIVMLCFCLHIPSTVFESWVHWVVVMWPLTYAHFHLAAWVSFS